MLPRLSVTRRSGCTRKLRLRNGVVGVEDEKDARELSGCKTCWLLIALYISCNNHRYS